MTIIALLTTRIKFLEIVNNLCHLKLLPQGGSAATIKIHIAQNT